MDDKKKRMIDAEEKEREDKYDEMRVAMRDLMES